MEKEAERGDRLTGGWKAVIVLAFLIAVSGNRDRGRREACNARREVDQLRFMVRRMDTEISALRGEINSLKPEQRPDSGSAGSEDH